MKEYIETRVHELVNDIKIVAVELDERTLLDFDAVSKLIWEHGDTKDVAAAAHSAGQIEALRLLAAAYAITVNDRTRESWEWAEVIQTW